MQALYYIAVLTSVSTLPATASIAADQVTYTTEIILQQVRDGYCQRISFTLADSIRKVVLNLECHSTLHTAVCYGTGSSCSPVFDL